MNITQDVLRERYDYDAETGILSWRVPASRNVRVGDAVGSISDSGYLGTKIAGAPYRVHRLIWLYVHGRWPTGSLDHKDRNRSNNRITNLREATGLQNRANSFKPNGSGFKGVSRQASTPKKPWRATLYRGRQCSYLGCFSTPEEAARAYDAAAFARDGDFAMLNFPLSPDLARSEGQ